MSKSTLPVRITENLSDTNTIAFVGRTIKVPCRLPEAFNFKIAGKTFTADIADENIVSVDTDGTVADGEFDLALAAADAILATIKAALGITGPVPPGSPLPAIALAYEAEVAAYEACTKAHRALPPAIAGAAMYWREPKEDSRSSLILSDYINYVMEQACKAQTERAEKGVK